MRHRPHRERLIRDRGPRSRRGLRRRLVDERSQGVRGIDAHATGADVFRQLGEQRVLVGGLECLRRWCAELGGVPGRAAGEDVLEIVGHGSGAGVAVLRALGQRPRHDVVERPRQMGSQLRNHGRVVVDHPRQDRGDVRRFEPAAAQQQGAEDRAEREDVRPRVGGVSERLLR